MSTDQQSWLLQYVGCLAINTSMKSLDFETRSMIAKECINRVCESAGLKTVDKKRRIEKRVAKMIAERPNLDNAGSDVRLTVSSSFLCLTLLETDETIATHEMPNISFASGGDAETLDFVAYVAKDSKHGRACFVLECGGGLAQKVITTIGQAFEMRFKEFLKKAPKNIASKLEAQGSCVNGTRTQSHLNAAPLGAVGGSDRDYYNDLPGKIPPEVDEFDRLENGHTLSKERSYKSQPQAAPRTCLRKHINSSSDQSPNLIDLTSDIPLNHCLSDNVSNTSPLTLPLISTEHQYVNFKSYETDEALGVDSTSFRDPFDMQPFNSVLERVSEPNGTTLRVNGATNKMLMDLEKEEWFHGPISRKESEILVANDGDFLIRESLGSIGQYVLTGMQNSLKKHLLLVDPEGVVRTKDKTFDSVSHLINYHRDNELPIISAESVLLLRTPVKRKR